jgi:hypothetical protein
MVCQELAAVWVFNAEKARLPGAVFSSRERAEEWIARHRLSGVLTAYPLDIGVYEWAIDKGVFAPKRAEHSSAAFIGGFTSAHMEHAHYEDGCRVTQSVKHG